MVDLRDRFRGCLLGLAVGDALGTTPEFCRQGTFEPITDMDGGKRLLHAFAKGITYQDNVGNGRLTRDILKHIVGVDGEQSESLADFRCEDSIGSTKGPTRQYRPTPADSFAHLPASPLRARLATLLKQPPTGGEKH